METWKKILIPTLITLAIGGIYLLLVWKHRQDPGVIGRQQQAQAVRSDSDVTLRSFAPEHFADTLRLEGTTVWMKNGYTISYYPYVAGHVVFGKKVGLVPATERLDVKKVVKVTAPPAAHDGLEPGGPQAFAVFALAGKVGLFAMPIGVTGEDELYYSDIMFYYDDPHTIYSHWPKDVWAAIDARQVKPGMSERQTQMAIGRNRHSESRNEGDRTVTYDVDGKHWTVTYVDDKATVVKSE